MAQPTPEHLEYLRANPHTAEQFDEVYGAGASQAATAPEQAAEQTAAPEAPTEQSTLDNLGDLAVSVVDGIRDGGQATLDLAKAGGDYLQEQIPLPGVALGDDAENGVIGFVSPEELAKRGTDDINLPDPRVEKPEGIANGLVHGASQFLTGFVGAGAALKTTKWVATSVRGKIVKSATQGAIADFAAFNEHEERLSNFLEETFPDHMATPIFDYLASSDEDGVFEGRAKQMIEGLFLGGAVEGGVHLAKGVFNVVKKMKVARKLRANGQAEEADALLSQAQTETEAAMAVKDGTATEEQLSLFDNLERQDVPSSSAQADTVNGVSKTGSKPVKKHLDLSDAELAKVHLALENGDLEDGLDHIRFNTETWDDKDPLLAVNELFKLAQDRMPGTMNESLTWAKTQRDAAALAKTPEELLRNYSQVAQFAAEDLPKFHWAVDTVKRRLWSQWAEGARTVDLNDDAAVASLDNLFDLSANLEVDFGLVNRGVGRTLNINRASKQAADGAMDADAIQTAIKSSAEMSGDRKAFYKRAGRLAGKPHKLRKYVRASLSGKSWDVHNEIWMASILSGAKTHMINIGSNAFETVVRPLENGLSAAFRGDIVGARAEVMGHYMGVYSGLRDTLTLAREAMGAGDVSETAMRSPGGRAVTSFVEERNILDPFHTIMEGGGTGAAVKEGGQVTPRNPAAVRMGDGTGFFEGNRSLPGIVNSMGKTFRIPLRLLGSEDEFFKQINYRAAMTTKGYKEGMRRGFKGKQLSEFASKFVDETGFDGTGKAIDQEALQYSREVTFTQDLEYGIGRQIQKAINEYSAFRGIVPFVRSPTNLIRHTMKRFPILGLLQHDHRRILFNGGSPSEVSDLMARQTVGAAMLATAVYMSNGDQLVGASPKDPDLRREFSDAGKLEYSFKVGDEYFQFGRLDPRFMIFGLVADYTRVMGDDTDDQSGIEFATALLTSMTSQLTNKLYFKGIADVIDAVSSEDPRVMEKFMLRRLGSYIPTAIAQFADNEMKEVRDVADAMLARLPGFSDQVEAKRNILGQKRLKPAALGPDRLSPIARSSGLQEEALLEMERLEHGFGLPREKIGRIDLTEYRNSKTNQSAYDRWQELAGEITLGGKTLTDALNKTVASDRYKRLPEQDDLPEGLDSMRVQLIQQQIDRYRRSAYRKMLRESPFKKLSDDLRLERTNKRKAARKGVDAILPLSQ